MTPESFAQLCGTGPKTTEEEQYLERCRPYIDRCASPGEALTLERLFLLGHRLTHERDSLSRERLRKRLIRDLLRIRNKDGRLIPIRPNKVQRHFSRNATARNIVLKARQVGITTWIAARFFIETITRPGTLSVQVAHDQSAARQIFRIVHRFWSNLPEWLRKGVLRTSLRNLGQLVFPLLDSEYRVETAADQDAGRGLTIQNLHASEVARWPGDAYETLAALRAAVTPKGQIVLESTPSGASGCFYEEWRRASETGYTRHFYPWWMERSYVLNCHSGVGQGFSPDSRAQRATEESLPEVESLVLTDEELGLKQKHRLTDVQIAFRRELQRNYRGLAKQEFAEDAESCFLASGDCYFDVDAIDRRLAQLPPLPEGRTPPLSMYLPPLQGRRYVIGVDTAGGGSQGDYSCAQVIDVQTGVQCAELHGRWTPQELVEQLVKLGTQYNHAQLAIEKNNHGHAVIALLRVRNYRNLYEENGELGFVTNAATRPMILANLGAILIEAPHLLMSRALLSEMRTFIRGESGRGEAPSGANDDRVMACALAFHVLSVKP